MSIVGLTLPAFGAWAQTAGEWVREAREHYEAGRFAESSESYAHAIEAGAENPQTFFDAACAAALADRIDAAFEHLDGALKRGFLDEAALVADEDLRALHDDPRWTDVVARCRAALAALEHPALRRELLEMRRIDQAMRRGEAIPELEGKTWGDVDGAHTARMKAIVRQHGWPTTDMVGEDGARSAWLLVQHADADVEFQRRCLELMDKAPAGQVSAIDVAYLTDRVLVNEGKKQIYGTQFWMDGGELVPRPIEDESAVEARRAAVGMITMQEYHKRMTGRDWVPKPRAER